VQRTPIVSFCDGSVLGTACTACGNNGAVGHGCANATFVAGGLLSSSGSAGVSNGTDTFDLRATNLTGIAVFFQSTGLSANAILFGDGELCASVGIMRLGLGLAFPQATYPSGSAPRIHLAGGPLQAGDLRHYQCSYRDPANFCTPGNFNLTQGLSVVWHF
jgi:hypothetical protein